MRNLLGGLAITATLLALVDLGIAGVPAPLSGSGDFSFSADLPVFPDEHGGRVDLAIRLAHPEIEFELIGNQPPVATIEMTVKMARQGIVAVDTTQVYELLARSPEDALSSTRYQLIEMPLRPGPGRWATTITLHDRGRQRRKLNTDRVESTVSGTLDVPRWEPGSPRMSDPEFRTQSGGESLVNPERMFGVSQDTLLAYLELADVDPVTAYVIDVEVSDPVFGGMGTAEWVLRTQSTHVASMFQLPLTSFPEGSYQLSLVPRWDPDQRIDEQFSVTWRMDRVVQTGRDVHKEAFLVLEPSEWKRFQDLSRPAQSQVLQQFWDRQDPTPGTVANERYERFLSRVAYADRHYAAFGRPGALTDRGRIHVHYGLPLEIEVHVVPLNGQDLELAIGQVHNTYQMDRPGHMAKDVEKIGMQSSLEAISSEERRRYVGHGVDSDIGADQKRNVGRIGEEGSFEVWEYTFQGDPLFPDESLTWSSSLHARFLFVDRLGTGDYHLEFTNVPLRF